MAKTGRKMHARPPRGDDDQRLLERLRKQLDDWRDMPDSALVMFGPVSVGALRRFKEIVEDYGAMHEALEALTSAAEGGAA